MCCIGTRDSYWGCTPGAADESIVSFQWCCWKMFRCCAGLLVPQVEQCSGGAVAGGCLHAPPPQSPHCVLTVHVLVQGAEDAAVLQMVCQAVSAVLDRVHSALEAVRDFTTHQLPALLSGLLQFASAQEFLQSLVLPVVAQCLGQFPAATLQAKAGTDRNLLSIFLLVFAALVNSGCPEELGSEGCVCEEHSVEPGVVVLPVGWWVWSIYYL